MIEKLCEKLGKLSLKIKKRYICKNGVGKVVIVYFKGYRTILFTL